jgi:hypothetical protein
MATRIDWAKLSRKIGLRHEGAGSEDAKRALEVLLGKAALRGAVDYYIAGKPGSELARNVLRYLHSGSAMARCYEIFRKSKVIETRRAAVELLSVVGDHRTLKWVPEFLRDRDKGLQILGADLLDQLLWSGLVEPPDALNALRICELHGNPGVRKKHRFIKGYLGKRGSRAK